MAQGRSTQIISMIEWIRTSRLPIKNSLLDLLGAEALLLDARVQPDFVLRDQCFGLRVSGSRSCFTMSASGFGFRVQGVGYMASGLWFGG
jgi:hypothetical protein